MSKKYYRGIEVGALNYKQLEKLRASPLPDESLRGVRVKFTHKGGSYTIIYRAGLNRPTSIEISGHSKYKTDFLGVEGIVFRGLIKYVDLVLKWASTGDRHTKIYGAPYIPNKLTQSQIADLVETLRLSYSDVTITKMIYRTVPITSMPAVKDLCLPLEKIIA